MPCDGTDGVTSHWNQGLQTDGTDLPPHEETCPGAAPAHG